MGFFTNLRDSVQRFLYGTSITDLRNKVAKEKQRNKILKEQNAKLQEELFNERLKTQELNQRLVKSEKKLNQIQSQGNQEITFKTYYSILGVDGSTASFEITVNGVFSKHISSDNIVKELSSERFFDTVLSQFDLISQLDSSLISGIRTSGVTTRSTDNEVSKFLAVSLDTKNEKKKSFDRGQVRIENPF